MNKRLLSLLLIVLALFADVSAETIYVININDEIGSTTWQHTRRGLDEAKRQKAKLVVFRINTYGGTMIHADSMRTAILHSPIPTVAFIDNNAASAGALIAIACDSIFMRSEASMGAATVVNGTDGAAMPDKYQSYMRAIMRATAESHGRDASGQWRRDPQIAQAMVDPTITIPGLIDDNKVLTLTATEAVKYSYADGIADNINEVIHSLNIPDPDIHSFNPTWIDSLMGFFTNPAVQGILIMLIIGGIYFEIQTPGVGIASVVAIMAAILYFLPLYITGIASSWIVLLFLAGLLLLLLEIFVIPGFGVPGISGIVCMIAAIFMGLLENYSLQPGHINTSVVFQATVTFIIAAALAAAAILFLTSRYAPKFVKSRTVLTHCQDIDKGYIGVDPSLYKLIGSTALTITDMRPAGKISIDGTVYDAVSTLGFIASGEKVAVVKYENTQLYITPLNATEA